MAFKFLKKKEPQPAYPEEKESVLEEPDFSEGAESEKEPDFGPEPSFGEGPEPSFEEQSEPSFEERPRLPPMQRAPMIQPPRLQQAPAQMPSRTLENFKAGFRLPEELSASSAPRSAPMMPVYPEIAEAMSPMLQPRPAPRPLMTEEEPEEEMGVFGSMRGKPFGAAKPHIFIRVGKYREVMDAVTELHRKIGEAKEDLESINDINNQEADKLKEAAEVVLRIEDMLRYLETTFTSPEE